MICPKCGSTLNEDKVCEACGFELANNKAKSGGRAERSVEAKQKSGNSRVPAIIACAVALIAVTVLATLLVQKFLQNKSETVPRTESAQAETQAPVMPYTDEGYEKAYEPTAGGRGISVGDIISFGRYEQNCNFSDGKERIEWQVLAVDGEKALVISRYGLDAVAFNNSYVGTNWENCSLRSWLNDYFYNEAFSSEEKNGIILTRNVNQSNSEYGTYGCGDTYDNIFALSEDEAGRYFRSDDARSTLPTDYALYKGASKNTYSELLELDNDHYKAEKYAGHCWWWLRTPGQRSDNAAYIFASGIIGTYGRNVDRSNVCVRPAMWINY